MPNFREESGLYATQTQIERQSKKKRKHKCLSSDNSQMEKLQ